MQDLCSGTVKTLKKYNLAHFMDIIIYSEMLSHVLYHYKMA